MIDEHHLQSDHGTPTASPALQLLGVSVVFGGIRALSDVSMKVDRGQVHGLMGPNGAGKTTLFDVVSGIGHPTTGTVVLDGVDVSHWSPVRRARHGLRRTFQRVQVFGRLTVADNLLLPLEQHRGGGGLMADILALPGRRRLEVSRRLHVAEIAEQCGLASILDRPAGSLAIGLCRQVELARALIAKPHVLLLDEPTSGLDQVEAERLSGLVVEVARAQSCGILLVEHDVSFLMGHCQTITVLDLGRVIAEGSPAEIQANPGVQAAYFDSNGPA
jgi:branched-chain amino acid transport system ATP-binding protein